MVYFPMGLVFENAELGLGTYVFGVVTKTIFTQLDKAFPTTLF